MLSRCLIIDVCQGECTDIRIQTPPPQDKRGTKAPNESQSPPSRRHSTNTCIFIQQSAHTQHLLSYTHTCKSTHAKENMQTCTRIQMQPRLLRCCCCAHINTQTQTSVSCCSHSVSVRHTRTPKHTKSNMSSNLSPLTIL